MKADSGIQLAALKVDGRSQCKQFPDADTGRHHKCTGHRPKCVETTAMGAAYLAGLAVGYWSSKEEVLKNWAIDRTFDPKITQEERTKRIRGGKKL